MSELDKWLDDDKFGVIPLDTEQPETAVLNPPPAQAFDLPSDQAEKKKIWEIDYYTPYFAVDTSTVVERLKKVFNPTVEFRDADDPDLWCPFWCATTLVFLLAIVGHVSSGSLAGTDVSKIVSAAMLVYSVFFCVPLAVSCYLSHLGSRTGLVQTVSAYGYSFVPLLVGTLLCLMPDTKVRWLVSVAAGAYGAYFYYKTLKEELEQFVPNKPLGIGLTVGGHALVVLFMNLYFFS